MSWEVKGEDSWGDPISFTFKSKELLDAFWEGFHAVRRNDDAYLDDDTIKEIKDEEQKK